MNAARQLGTISVEDYLAGELISSVKHEYLGGFVYAMAGARISHNNIAGNVFASLHTQLRGKPCRPYNSDTKARVRLPNQTRFYYTDTMVVCRSNDPRGSFQDEPVVVVEVLSKSTRRTDEGEKKDAYLSIPSLSVYLLIEQDTALVSVYRRAESGFVREFFEGMTSVIPLPEIGAQLALAEIYEAVEFVPEPDEDQSELS